MGNFQGDIVLRKTSARTWEVYTPFSYKVSDADIIRIPEKFSTDFASVPRPFWNIFPPDGKYTPAAIVHDYLYNQRHFHGRKRSECDGIFLRAMKDLGVSWISRTSIYSAVRLGGWVYWNKK